MVKSGTAQRKPRQAQVLPLYSAEPPETPQWCTSCDISLRVYISGSSGESMGYSIIVRPTEQEAS
jgi:hypothetical protein